MNLELTIQSMYDYYPTLFKERADCLSHLFTTVGNGYYWKDGELISNDDNYSSADLNELNNHLVNGKAFQHNKLSLRAESIYYDNLRKEENPNYLHPLSAFYSPEEIKRHHEAYLKTIPDDQYYIEPNRRYRWGCCHMIKGEEYLNWAPDYMKLFNYPENIKPDWFAAIEETKKLLKEDGLVHSSWEDIQ